MKKNADKTLENIFGFLVVANWFVWIYITISYELNFIFAIVLFCFGTGFTYALYKGARDERIKKERNGY
jgi:apolipoprotein N-acyltransferase